MNKIPTCLIIDSDSSGEVLFQKAVDNAGLTVDWKFVGSCREAIKHVLNLKNAAPDFVFFEWYMPGIDGFDCLLTLRQYSKLAGSSFVIYGGENPEEMYKLSVMHQCLLLPKSESVPAMASVLTGIFGLKSAHEL